MSSLTLFLSLSHSSHYTRMHIFRTPAFAGRLPQCKRIFTYYYSRWPHNMQTQSSPQARTRTQTAREFGYCFRVYGHPIPEHGFILVRSVGRSLFCECAPYTLCRVVRCMLFVPPVRTNRNCHDDAKAEGCERLFSQPSATKRHDDDGDDDEYNDDGVSTVAHSFREH